MSDRRPDERTLARLAEGHPLVQAYRADPYSLILACFDGTLTATERRFLLRAEPGLSRYPWAREPRGDV